MNWWIRPVREATAVTISGPTMEAPKSPIRSPPFQPIRAQASMMSISCTGNVDAGSPGGPVRFSPKAEVRTTGAATTMTETRVACISDMARTSPPASSPKTSMS